jgi:hypothetical protein
MEPKPEYPKLNKLVESLLKQRGSSLSKTSLQLGKAKNYLGVRLRTKNPPIGLLIELSNILSYNLLEAYRPFLEPEVRYTAHERHQMQQLADQAGEIIKLKEERDKYWRVIEGRFQ